MGRTRAVLVAAVVEMVRAAVAEETLVILAEPIDPKLNVGAS